MSRSQTTTRRTFLTNAAGLAAVAGASLAVPRDAHAAGAVESAPKAHDLDKWIDELKGEYRLVLDAVSPRGALEIGSYASTYLSVNSGAYQFTPAQSSVIVIVRNVAAAFGFADDAWTKFPLGDLVSADDPRTKARATRNVARGAFGALAAQGVTIAVCGMATQFLVGQIAGAKGGDPADIRKQLEASLLPGARIVPSGITTVDRCQRAKFSYAYVG